MTVVLKSDLDDISRRLPKKVADRVEAGAELIAKQAAVFVQVGKGPKHLRDDIHVEKTGRAEYTVYAGRRDTFYAHFLEFGTVHAAPFPFLIPAFEMHKDTVVAMVAEELDD